VPYFHVVFTVPHELGEVVRRHPQELDDILLRAAAQALIKLAADPHDVGGLIGVLGVLHTWPRTLADHPPVHCLVPARGVSADRAEWRPARPSYLVPVHALAKLLRGLFRVLVRQERPDLLMPESVWTKGWIVYCKPAVQGTEHILHDLGRYGHRGALTNPRLLSIADNRVCCRYQNSQDQRWKTMTLPAQEFIRRFLPHVWPQGFHNVRYYGLWSPAHRPLLHHLQLCLARHAAAPPPSTPEPAPQATDAWCPPLRAGQPCPSCGQGLLVVIRAIPRRQRGPP
jgi:Putative transposase